MIGEPDAILVEEAAVGYDKAGDDGVADVV